MKSNRSPSRWLALVALAVIAPFLAAAHTWQWRSPTPTGNRMNCFVYGGGQFVGVGANGETLTSPDGATWIARLSGVNAELTRVVFDGTRFVAIGGTNVLTSSDGLTWANHSSLALLSDLAWGNNTFVAIAAPAATGQPHRLVVSADAITWTLRDSSYDPNQVLFANGVFVAVDNSGNALSSADGTSWTAVKVTDATSAPFLAAGSNRFLLSYAARTFVSTNGTQWRDVTTQSPAATSPINLGPPSSLGFAGGYFYLQHTRYDSYRQFRSADAETWTPLANNLPRFDFSTLASGGSASVVSEHLRTVQASNPYSYFIWSSADGLAWTARTSTAISSGSSTAHSLVYGLGRFFCGDQTSHDGISWAPTTFAATHAAGDRVFRIASTYRYVDPSRPTNVSVSSDGLTGIPVDVKMATPRAIAFGQGRYVVVGAIGSISTSTDGVNWSSAATGISKDLQAVTYAFAQFVAVGTAGALLTSPDGLTWTAQEPAATGLNFNSIAVAPDRLVVGTTGTTAAVPAFTLSGGVPVEVASSRQFNTIAFFDGTFTGIEITFQGTYERYASWKVATSTDGKIWNDVPVPVGEADSWSPAIATGNGTALILLPNGVDYTAPTFYALLQKWSAGSAAPVITHPPVSTAIHRGESVSFGVGATGSGPLTYQWIHNGSSLAGATSPVLTLTSVTNQTAGDYSVTITNALGSATSAAAKLTVLDPVPLTITQQPIGGTLREFTPFFLSVVANGSGPVTYQWRRNGSPIYGGTSPTYQIWTSSYAMDSNAGTYDVVVTAPHSTVTSQAVVVLRSGPVVTITQPGSIAAGGTAIVTATATGKGPFTYVWSRPGGEVLAGATGATLILPNLTSADTGPCTVEVTDADGAHGQAGFMLVVTGAAPAPATSRVTVDPGQKITLRAPVDATWAHTYRWRFNGSPIAGATAWSYTVHADSPAANGSYEVSITNSNGGVSTYTTTVTVAWPRLINLSARGYAGTGEETMIQGFVLNGAAVSSGPNLLIRTVGPTLASFGVSGALADPALRVVDLHGLLFAENDNWATPLATGIGAPATSTDMVALGAFALPASSLDAALELRDPLPGQYTTQCGGPGTGVVLTEIYCSPNSAQRLVNLSARARVGSGDSILIAGFVIDGSTPLRVLLRAVGPTLGSYGIAHPLVNPKLTLYNVAGQEIHNNDTWSQAANVADLRVATAAAGAFTLPEGSNDAAMLEWLEPGIYTMHVTSVDGSSGIALAEIYEVR